MPFYYRKIIAVKILYKLSKDVRTIFSLISTIRYIEKTFY